MSADRSSAFGRRPFWRQHWSRCALSSRRLPATPRGRRRQDVHRGARQPGDRRADAAGISRDERERRRGLLKDNFAVQAIGQFVLGRHWRGRRRPARYLRLFEDLIVETYVDQFSRFSGENLRVTRTMAEADSGDVVVYSEINRPAGRRSTSAGGCVASGRPSRSSTCWSRVSMGQTQRSGSVR